MYLTYYGDHRQKDEDTIWPLTTLKLTVLLTYMIDKQKVESSNSILLFSPAGLNI